MKNKSMRVAAVSSLLAMVFSLSAEAALYTFNYTDSGPIPQNGPTFNVEHSISGIFPTVTSIELILTFNSSYHLNGTSINGTLVLDPSGSDTFASFSPTVTRPGTGGQDIYDMTFATFNTLNPNNTWALNLWDSTTSGIENSLVSWTLDITAVPEPVNVALGIFAGASAVVMVARNRRVRERVRRWRVAANAWIDAV